MLWFGTRFEGAFFIIHGAIANDGVHRAEGRGGGALLPNRLAESQLDTNTPADASQSQDSVAKSRKFAFTQSFPLGLCGLEGGQHVLTRGLFGDVDRRYLRFAFAKVPAIGPPAILQTRKLLGRFARK
jgi:hypothetical protein